MISPDVYQPTFPGMEGVESDLLKASNKNELPGLNPSSALKILREIKVNEISFINRLED